MKRKDGARQKTDGWSLEARIAYYSTPANDGTDCVLWVGAQTRGYGVLRYEGRKQLVTRILLERKLGRPLRPRMQACHSCHRPPCIHEDHLREGTAKDNAADRVAAGRQKHGIFPLGKSPNGKLTIDQVRDILRADTGINKLADKYGVDRALIYRIRRREVWARVEP